jgi:hypothetical protein
MMKMKPAKMIARIESTLGYYIFLASKERHVVDVTDAQLGSNPRQNAAKSQQIGSKME